MKKNLFILMILISSISLSQINMKDVTAVPMASPLNISETNTTPASAVNDALWYEDFSNSSIPNVITEDLGGFGDWRWSDIAPAGMWSMNTGIINSATPDGFMMMEADYFNSCPQNNIECVDADNNGINDIIGENAINAHFTIGPIDLSNAESNNLALQFYSDYRICCYAAGSGNNDMNVYISTDGGETFNDINFIGGDSYETNVQSEDFVQIPLSDFNANVNNVYFRFEWLGTHYYWMIDDMQVTQRPAYDLEIQSSWLCESNVENASTYDPSDLIEYYSIPKSQAPDQVVIGAGVYNYGYLDDNNIGLTGEIYNEGVGSVNSTNVTIQADSTGFIETDYFDISMLNEGSYLFTSTLTSSGNELDFDDNALWREFRISEKEYAIDGLYESRDYLGTGWPWGEDTNDGMMIGNYFDIKKPATLSSITLKLDTAYHPTGAGEFQTQAGGEVIAYLLDTAGIYNYLNGTNETLDAFIGGVIWESDFLVLEQSHVDNALMTIDVPEVSLNPNGYYVALEIYSNGLESPILFFDDTSVLQPATASMFYDPVDATWYTNPNAASLRIGLDGFEDAVSTIENQPFEISCFPNPSKNYLEINSNKDLDKNINIKIFNILGEVVLNNRFKNFGSRQIIDISNISNGSYILEIQSIDYSIQKKIIIQ
ncbi:MAG: hypothetical protein CMP65_00945 [Flavobacteriales bacterium]|nr:hypothetical protein [Flavobacteriales bacterium]